jgi:outer membrane receptor protein involved in Fe transport
MKTVRVLLFGLAVLALLGGVALAQTQFGIVTGRVTDAQGAVIASAKVTLTNLSTNVQDIAQSNAEGIYLFANVPAANYEVKVEKEGFRAAVRKITVEVAQRFSADFSLDVGAVTETIEVSGSAVAVNTISGEISREITSSDVANMPLLTRNPYNLVQLSAGAVTTDGVSGDNRGLGVSIAGARTSSVNFMLDGSENNSTFDATVAQVVPLDAVQEFKVQVSTTTSEFGRNAAVTNVITKSGTNNIHGSLYEYYRGAGLSTTPYEDKANNTPKANFVRNQFGASLGGPFIKDKTFYFGSFEAIRVRSVSTARFFVPTQEFYNASSANTKAFLDAFGGLPASNCSDVAMTAADFGGLNDANGNPIPAATNLFCRGTYRRVDDNGGGLPQNTLMWTGRVDHHFTDRTSLLTRYAWYDENDFAGTNSFSPYQGFNTGITTRAHNLNATLTHAFSPQLFNELRLTYNRYNNLQPLGEAPSTTPCWQYRSYRSTPTGDFIVFPGYVPDVCSFAGIPFGGPQNVYQFGTGFTYNRGKHTFKWGAQYLHMRDNRTFGAYENAYERTNSMQSMIDGLVDRVTVAIDPNGHVAGEVYDTAVDGPFRFPRFDRHFHYNEFAFYGEDSIKLTSRLTLTAGLRWEYFGVLHSPENEKYLDANLYLNAVGSFAGKSIFEQVRDARFRRTNHFYKSDYGDYGPRVGLAWDVRGNGRTILRTGYGLYYDRNFGNAVFNAIQNPPNYASVTLSRTGLGPIKPNQFDTLAAAGGATLTIASSARMLDNDMRTAYSAQWNATIEHDILGKGALLTISYLGANGYRLYSLNNLNQVGSCLRAPTINPGCQPDPALSAFSSLADTRLNQTGLTGMNRRGNEGMSRYNALTTEVKIRQLGQTGLSLTGNWTWSHSIDNESSFFADSLWESDAGFGFRDPYNPSLDRASSTNDIRHRGTIMASWAVPWARNLTGIAGQMLGGWNVSSIFTTQTGGAFSLYDDNGLCYGYDGTNFCFPVQTGPVPRRTETPTGDPNSFVLYNFANSYMDLPTYCSGQADPVMCEMTLWQLTPEKLAPRNQFRTPGMYNWDFALLKDFKLPREGMKLQFRAEAFNLLNHSNMYGVVDTNFMSSTAGVLGKKGVPLTGAKERRNIQLALRLTF